MVDREARDRMAQALRAYMGEEITAFEFDLTVKETGDATADTTVRAVQEALWCDEDGIKDHNIIASKDEWDYFNRLLLLLESNGELETSKSWRTWHPSQTLAALLFAAFLLIVRRTGLGNHLLAYALPFGPPSMLLAWINSRRREKVPDRRKAASAPFASVANLLATRRQVEGFAKLKYPRTLAEEAVHDLAIEVLSKGALSMMWCMFSPIALFFQMLPERDSQTRVRLG